MTVESRVPNPEVRRAWLDMNPTFREHMLALMLEGNPDILALSVLCGNIAKNILADTDMDHEGTSSSSDS